MKNLLCILSLLFLGGCAHMKSGMYYKVRAGDTPETVARNLGVDSDTVKRGGEFKTGKLIYITGTRRNSGMLDGLRPMGEYTKKTQTAQHSGIKVATVKDFALPLKQYKFSSGFGARGKKGKFHDGVDLVADSGSAIFAIGDGVVVYSGRRIKGYGNMVVVRHGDGLSSIYAHNKRNVASVGDKINKGQLIGFVGATGRATSPHLHLEIRKGEKPVDPLFYLPLK